MRKRTIDKLLQAAIVEQAAEQGELWDREPVLEPIPEESQKRFDAALYGEPPKQTGAEDFFGQPAPKPAPGPKRRRVLAFALTGVSLAAVVLVVGLMIGVSRGEKGIKPDVLAPVNPDAQSTNAPPAGAGVRPAEAPAPGLAEPTDTPTPEPGAAGESGGPAFFLNGKERNIYTSHYFIEDEETSIPLNAFLASVGAVAVDSPYNRYMVQCYEIQGIRYIYDWESQVFALEEPYDEIVQKLKAEGRTPTEADFREIDLFAQEGYEPEMQAETWLDHRILERVLRKMGLDISIEIDREANAIRVEMRELHPFFTCTGTEYGAYPIVAPKERRAEAEALFAAYRELFELAAAEWPDLEHFGIADGEAYCWDEAQRKNETVDPATLPESLQKLIALSAETGIHAYQSGPEPVFAEDAAPYFKVEFPRAIDTTYQDPGILYEVWLIYTANTAEQIRYSEMEPLAENWYIEVYFYAY